MHKKMLFGFVWLLLLLCACREGQAEDARVSAPATALTGASALAEAPSATAWLTATLAAAQTTPSPTRAPATPTPVPTATAIPSPTPLPFELCSPFPIYPLQELPEIISDPYHPPPAGREERHHGVDFSHYRRGELLTIEGVALQAVLPGVVALSLADSFPYGNVIIIETSYELLPFELRQRIGMAETDALYLLYAHLLQAPQVQVGQAVTACQLLGQVGKSGNAVEAHLHLETRLGPPGVRFTEMGFYKADDTASERAAYVRWRTGGEFRHFDPLTLLVK